ncbi:putative tripeptidyl-peptidase II [Helianthus annuus]|uniref:Putative peptidase S8, subtilisin-related protein n=1 Tax=Helianthus annuus TaxID=4232 RepID=A0A251TZJ8_HELAN|nr:subtilisin-like protease SBT1.7 [Helianthus annuus]KAF5792249.1 putative tripeptidyl-peptidase II [Helianthus annuus]KAJ0527215.1 putative tripeptidyl-peptidase II [Helianthus annuus]KAJ0535878.1 putative tripeptidyl-peptidase II [Helianthus annuus]KAJ0543618.1 putative tripeptidyl-peptidase II [Helianthus annuus]KAJ0708673.1 putative tripeptidyl-peptidase II [Helianthus annuus]
MKPKNVFLMTVMAIMCYRYCYVAADPRKTYIVHMDKSLMPMAYSHHLHWYDATMRGSVSKPTDMLYAYDKVMHGFTTRLTVDEAKLLKRKHGVVSIQEEPIYELQTTRSPEFLGLDDSSDVMLSVAKSEVDVIVGVLDTGVWPGSKSLDDTGFGPIPSRWKGICQNGTGFNESSCNKKLIGARYFLRGYEASLNGTFNENVDSRSPVDENGHGTHCATIAVGSAVTGASLFGYAKGTARGMAPHARLAVYKACWRRGCFGSDVLATVEAAISDGVDILSMSFGCPLDNYFLKPIAYMTFRAVSHGIFVSIAAGNDGPASQTVMNNAPWVITVGASSLDRDFPAYVTLGNGKNFSGVSMYTSEEPLPGSMVPLVFAGHVSNISYSNLCFPGSLPQGSVTGKIVMCEMGWFSEVKQGMVVKEAGGVGMILANTVYRLKELEVDLHLIPTIVVNKRARDEIKSYIVSNHNSEATISFEGTKLGVQPSPIVAAFSGRGPNPNAQHLLKPDIIAPGVNILAGWSGKASPSGLENDTRRVEFNIKWGTSMACPHVSGIAVLLKIAHPEWSPAAIKSALMTTAYNTYKNSKELLDVVTGEPATPFDLGAGHVNPISALNPGLVYNASTDDYLSFLCALNLNATAIRKYDESFKCVKGRNYRAEDLNYPSFMVPLSATSGQTVVNYTRTLTNVNEGAPTTYKVSTSSKTRAVKIKVEPEELTFIKKNEKKVYTVTFTAMSRPPNTTRFGRLAWSGGNYTVNSPIAFIWK